MKKIFTIICILPLFFGCAYYGKDTYLSVANKEIDSCSNVKVEIDPMMISSNRASYAIVGVPIFPGKSDTNTSDLHTLFIHYKYYDEYDVCRLDDIYLEEVVSNIKYSPEDLWKSKVVEGDDYRYVGCMYRFKKIDEKADYVLVFKKGLFGCNLPKIPLIQKTYNGYHDVPLQ